uniref:Receptor-like serine/threonine-protein kinase n=1 Tax=Kalanchoe fedtschenkoi TaxID=63787 RepID=A0A7N0UYR9_KALFE
MSTPWLWVRMSKNTVIWVANRELPVVRTPGKLALVEKGVLVISDSGNVTIWTSNSSKSGSNSLAAQLLNTGNFVVRDVNNGVDPDEFLWQGFDYPCDTQIPGLKIGYDVRRKRDLYQAAWKSLDDPAESEYTFKLDLTGVPQYFLRKGSQEVFRSGPWNGLRFSGRPNLKPNSVYRFWYRADDEWIYYGYEPIDSSVLLRTVVNVDGALQRFIWNERNHNWNLFLTFATDNCDTYNWCGPYASCNINNSPACKCLTGYVPKSQTDWDTAGWGEGCVRKIAANCSREDHFIKLSSIKVPDTRNALGDMNLSLDQCRISCLNNCSCTAYGTWNVTDGGRGCLLWFGELKDIRLYTEYGQDIYVRVDPSEAGGISSNRRNRKLIAVAAVLSAVVAALIIVLVLHLRKKRKQHIQRQRHLYEHEAGDDNSRRTYSKEINNGDLELPLFDMETVSKATKNFSVANKLGEGGFGPVYKGVLKGGQEIAAKKLSQDSKQGSDEFKNEVMCIAKLQHRNLVKLLGCCIQEEYMLIYEFLPNKSLDLFIFDEKRSALLDWPKRLNIINGIARGLLYLHQDSRLRIVHRDLKASNILLDCDLNPKISDFGMARICGGNETAASTNRIVGTYGYMSPEYAIDGQFSVKSDVFSFGVLILEIVSGRRNRGFYHPNHHLNLLGHTWKLYNTGQFSDAIHETLKESCIVDEVLRALHIGLLCVQQNASDRPNMASVVLMLSSDSSALPPPKVPGFFTARNPIEADSSSGKHESCSTNEMSVTLIDPR